MARRGPSNTTFAPATLSCRIFGCRWRFGAEGRQMSWWCERGCPSGGSKVYDTAEEAGAMAAALDREPSGPFSFLAMLGGTLHREPRQRDPS